MKAGKTVSGEHKSSTLLEYVWIDCTKSWTHRIGFVNSEEGYMTEKSRSTALNPALMARLYEDKQKMSLRVKH